MDNHELLNDIDLEMVCGCRKPTRKLVCVKRLDGVEYIIFKNGRR